MSVFLRKGILYLVFEGFSKGAIFAVTPFVINVLGPKEYGEFSLYLAYIPVVSIVLDLGLRSAVKREFLDHPKQINYLISSYQVLIFALFLLGFIVALSNGNLFWVFVVLNSYLLCGIEQYLSRLQISGMSLKYNLVFVVKNALPYLLFIFLIYFNHSGLYYFFYIQAVVCFIILMFFFLKDINIIRPRIYTDIRRGLIFSIPLLPSIFSGFVLSLSDRYLIKYYFNEVAVANYSLAYNVASIFFISILALNKSWQPFILKCLKAGDFKKIKSKAKNYLLLALMLLLLVFFTRDHIIIALSNKTFLSVSNLVVQVLIGMFFYLLFTLYSNVAFFHKETFYFSLPAILGALVNVILNIILLPIYGYEVAAATTIISYFVQFVVIALICKLRYKFSLL